MIKKQTIYKYILVLFLALIITNCVKKEQKININVLGENSSNLSAMEALKDKYELLNEVNVNFKPNSFENAYTKAIQDFTNKTGYYDIVLQYNFSLSSYVRNNYVYVLSDLTSQIPESEISFESDLFPNAWKEVGYYYSNPNDYRSEPTPIGYPFAANTMLLLYNKEMFNSPYHKEKYFQMYND